MKHIYTVCHDATVYLILLVYHRFQWEPLRPSVPHAVPFMYNLDEHVEGLDVMDFPGVDDEDDSIPDLADLLLTIAQIVIFVVDYR